MAEPAGHNMDQLVARAEMATEPVAPIEDIEAAAELLQDSKELLLGRLGVLHSLGRDITMATEEAAYSARVAGLSWAAIAEPLETSAQNLQQKYKRKFDARALGGESSEDQASDADAGCSYFDLKK